MGVAASQEGLLERLRKGRDGWSGDAFCIEAETAEEAADRIDGMERALWAIEQATRRKQLPLTAEINEIAINAIRGTYPAEGG